ncbi:MAG TPA: hypothetical protein VHS54_13100, partial [Jatrophihabitans sp.]|nr:hypothetical protein [Jatrophihabitans sp.]
VLGFVAQSENAPVPFVPTVALLLVLLLVVPVPLLLEHAVSPSASAAIPAINALPLWTLTGE